MTDRRAFEIGTHRVLPGSRRTVDLPVSVLSDHTPVNLSVHVIHGRKPGPTLFASAAIHGDEVIGVEILRRLLHAPNLDGMAGTFLAVPIVNTFGFLGHTRYLPDRRDLNRSFPGSSTGSLAGRLAHLFLTEVVTRAEFGIDIHSAAIHRTNLPQIRVSSRQSHALELANVFAPPVVMTSALREGSLRQVAQAAGVPILLYEAGEGLRFDEFGVRAGVTGILRVMRALGMVSSKGISKPRTAPIWCSSSRWIRAPAGGLLRSMRTTGQMVAAGEVLGVVSDPLGEVEAEITAEAPGIVIGRTNLPVVNEGDALFHIGEGIAHADPGGAVGRIAQQLESDPLFDEDEII